MTAGVPYSFKMIGLSGNPVVVVYDANYNVTTPTTTYAAAYDTFFGSSSINNASFIAPANGTAYATVVSTVASTFTVAWSENLLTADGPVKANSTYGDSVYYAFDAVSGTSYQVKLRPTSGDADIAAVSPNTSFSGSVGSSTNAGTQTDSVFFTAAATQRYYIKVGSKNVDTDFEISVQTVPTAADLTVDIDSAQSDGSNIIINYTVTNVGGTGFTGNVQVDGWSNAGSAPAIGMTGEASNTHTGVTISALGGAVTGTLTIPNSSDSGTAYLVVDTINAIAEGNENNNVSSAASWAKPILAPVTYDFEAGVIPAKTVMSGSANWLIDNTTGGSSSSKSIGSGTISDSAQSCFALNVYNSQSMSIAFDYSVSSELNYDYLRFYIDGSQKSSWSGTVGWTNTSFSTYSGLHEFKWCYTKDFTTSSGADRAWVDNIVITSAQPELSVSVTNAVADGANVQVYYSVYNNSAIPAGPFNVDLWSNSASTPTVGSTGEASVTVSSVGAYSTATGSVTIPNTATSGTAYAIVDTTNAVSETNETNNVSSAYAWAITYPDLSVSVVKAVSDGANVTVYYSVYNNSAAAAGAFSVDLWSDSASAPTVGSTGETSVAITSLGAYSYATGSATIANTATTGTAYAIVDSANAITESNETNNVSTGVAWAVPISTYDFESGAVPGAFVMSGNASWSVDSTTAAGGSTYSLRGGVITNSQTTCTEVSATGSTGVSFDYSVSSESSFDYLYFYIDGVQQGLGWSGTVPWSSISYYPITSGTHTYKWCYIKDVSVSVGSDTAWIDNIAIY